jgi:integrase/recombinase XerC
MTTLGLDPAAVFAEAARLRETLVRDKTYLTTPIGQLAGQYLDELRFDNYSPKTILEREYELARLAVYFGDRQPDQVDLADLKQFLSEFWKDAARATRSRVASTVRVFFNWAHENDRIPTNPARKLKGPRVKDDDSTRRAHALATVRTLIRAQLQTRDQLAVTLMYWCALRRAELREVQVCDFDFAERLLVVHGKGGTRLEQALPRTVANDLELYFRDIDAQPAEYLLYPQKIGRYGSHPFYTWEVIWEDRLSPLSLSGVDKWWQRCRDRAGFSEGDAKVLMHELRHTAATHFHQEGHDLVATQHFLRHKNASTTARTYVHLDRVRAVADVQRRMTDPLEDA